VRAPAVQRPSPDPMAKTAAVDRAKRAGQADVATVPSGPPTARRRSPTSKRARRPAPVKTAPTSRSSTHVMLDGEQWQPVRDVAAAFERDRSQLEQRLVGLADKRRQLEQAQARLETQLAEVAAQVAGMQDERERLPDQEAVAAGAALAGLLAQGAVRFPEGAWPVALVVRIEAGTCELRCALPLAADKERGRYGPGTAGWRLAGAATLGLRRWAAELGGELGQARVRHEPAGSWSVLWLEVPFKLGRMAVSSAAPDGLAQAVAASLSEHLATEAGVEVDVGIVPDAALRHAVEAACSGLRRQSGHEPEHRFASPPACSWLEEACRQLSLTPLAVAAQFALLGLPPDEAGADSIAALAQRLGRPLRASTTDQPTTASDTPALEPETVPGRSRGVRLGRNIAPEMAIRALTRAGWVHDRTSGDHAVLEKAGCATRISLPVARHHLAPGRLLGLIKEAGLSEQEFMALL